MKLSHANSQDKIAAMSCLYIELKPSCSERFILPRVFGCFHSFNEIIPLVQEWIKSFKTHTEQFNASTRYNYALYAVLDRDNPHALEQYGWMRVPTILSTPRQHVDALLLASGKFEL